LRGFHTVLLQTMMEKEKVCIVGAGLAGCVMACTLFSQGYDVVLCDSEKAAQGQSSRVAAGLFNPVLVGRKKLTWMTEALFASFPDFYSYWENNLAARFFYPMPLIHQCDNFEELNDWDVWIQSPSVHSWIQYNKAPLDTYLKPSPGAFSIAKAGWVDTLAFMEAVHDFFEKKNAFRSLFIGIEEENKLKESLRIGGELFQKIVFCRGFREKDHSLFSFLPFHPVKGQVLSIETAFDLSQVIYHRSVFLLPLSKRRARVGSTYTWDIDNICPTESATHELTKKLSKMIDEKDFTIVEAQAGIRPAVHGRRPLLGEHPHIKGVYVLNGLGSKGVSLAPYMAQMLTSHLQKGLPLQMDVDISRLKVYKQLLNEYKDTV
jgi:glycine/D-amino acid oxidase-like deaminating enzyme